MKLNDFKDVMDNCFGDRHENISDKKEVDRNTIIIKALANYYDHNPLSKEDGREVIKIIKDIQAEDREVKANERLHNFLTDDLKKLEYHTQELIENIYNSGQSENFKEDIEEIETFFSYWKQHIKGLLTKTK